MDRHVLYKKYISFSLKTYPLRVTGVRYFYPSVKFNNDLRAIIVIPCLIKESQRGLSIGSLWYPHRTLWISIMLFLQTFF